VRHGRRDTTHAEVRDGWRAIVGHASVRDTADLGGDFGDLVLGYGGLTFVLEVKRDVRAKLSHGQAAVMSTWRGGPWLRVDGFADSLAKVGAELERFGVPAPVLSSNSARPSRSTRGAPRAARRRP
jgi:hypothetical protein